MASLSFQYNKPSETYTIDQFIACQSDTEVNYQNLSFVDNLDYVWMNEIIKFPGYNTLRDYLDELRDEYSVTVVLTEDDLQQYIYRPKLLCHDIYGKGELFFIILLMNDMCSVKQFNRTRLHMPTRDQMNDICKCIYNANNQAIIKYNDQNN